MRKIEPKESEMGIAEPMGNDKKPTKIYPRLMMEHNFFPETKKWKVGKEYEVKLKLKMTGLSISKFQNNSEFDIVACEMDDMEKEED